ncbi:MAG: hypothetical protein V1775_00275 [Bacteroidota bacterium]
MGRKKKMVVVDAAEDLTVSLNIAPGSFVDDSDSNVSATPGNEEPVVVSVPEAEKVVSIVIPYVTSTAHWDELRMALRSIAANALFPCRLFIVADKLPDWVSDDVTLIPCGQVQGQRFAKSFDAVNKLKAVIACDEVSQEFIYTYDDTVFLKKGQFSNHAIAVSLFPSGEIIEQWDASAIWKEVVSNTLLRLVLNNRPMFNYETHLPRVFNKTRLNDVFNRYGFQKRPYLVASIYFNDQLERPDLLITESPDIKADIRSSLTPEQIENETANKAFLNYNDQGLTDALKAYLLGRFPEKCLYER